MSCNCGCGGTKSTDGRRRAFAERATKLALSLPDDVTCTKNYKPPEAQFLSSLRDLAAECSLALTWSESEAESRAAALRFADAAVTYGFSTVAEMPVGGGGGGSGESCTARCNREKDECRGNCDNDPDAGYFCYFDCRLAYFACLASCITHGSSVGGGETIA